MPSHQPSPSASSARRLSDRRGFTVIEVVCAAFVLVFAIASSIVAMRSGFRSMDLARGLTLASQVLQSEIESIRLKSWDEISDTTTYRNYDPTSPQYIVFPDTGSGLEIKRRGITVEYRFSPISNDRREITMVATWSTRDGMKHTRSTKTVYCKDGLNDYFATNPNRTS
jgi:type II secretory pathway pseudopilin PulG